MKKMTLFLFLTVACLVGTTTAFSQGFSGPYAPANWVVTDDAGGSVDFSAAPASISVTSGNSSIAGNTIVSYTFTSCPTIVSFNWSISHVDCFWDNLYYGVNGVWTFLGDCNNAGSVTGLSLNTGDVL